MVKTSIRKLPGAVTRKSFMPTKVAAGDLLVGTSNEGSQQIKKEAGGVIRSIWQASNAQKNCSFCGCGKKTQA